MKCEDCGNDVQGTDTELGAILAGLTICDECMASMEDEAEAYEQVMRDEGFECVFDPERGFMAVPIGAGSGPLIEMTAVIEPATRTDAAGHGER